MLTALVGGSVVLLLEVDFSPPGSCICNVIVGNAVCMLLLLLCQEKRGMDRRYIGLLSNPFQKLWDAPGIVGRMLQCPLWVSHLISILLYLFGHQNSVMHKVTVR